MKNKLQKRDVSDVIFLECGHQCRNNDPADALNYTLKGKSKNLTKFEAICKVEMFLQVDDYFQRKTCKKKYSQKFRILFPKEENKIKVRND